jgi:hypothetical protein
VVRRNAGFQQYAGEFQSCVYIDPANWRDRFFLRGETEI